MLKNPNQRGGNHTALALLVLCAGLYFHYTNGGSIPSLDGVLGSQTQEENIQAPEQASKPVKPEVVLKPTHIVTKFDTNIYQDEYLSVLIGTVETGVSLRIKEEKTQENSDTVFAYKISANGINAWVKANDVDVTVLK